MWKREGEKKNIPCPQIDQEYKKSTEGETIVSNTIILLSLYQVSCKTKHWYQKIFWNFIDMAKMNAWILYGLHFPQNGKSRKDNKYLLKVSLKLPDTLVLANKVNPAGSRRRPPKRRSLEAPSRVNSLLKHCLSPMFILIKLHIDLALLPTKSDACYAV